MVARAVCPLSAEAAEREIVDMIGGLVLYNVRIYRSGRALAPWGIRWVPDARERCVVMHDAKALLERGYGSCGELAAAYAAWLRTHGDEGAQVQLTLTGTNEWHAVAVASDGRVYDPANIGVHHAV